MCGKNIFLIYGASGSGKTTVTKELCERYGLQALQSYTTRPKRSKDEWGHKFLSKEEFEKIKPNLCAYTSYAGYEYGATQKQVEASDLYTIDYEGIKYFHENYKGKKNPIVIRLISPEPIRKSRMKNRGDSENEINGRLSTDTVFQRHIPWFLEVKFVNTDLDSTVKSINDFIESTKK